MNQEFEHLSDAQIENYGYGPDQGDSQTDRAIESHLAACEQCRSRLLAHERSRLGLMIDFPVTAARGTNCPPEDSLRNLAAGVAPASDATRITQHAAQCDYCGPILRAYTQDFSDELSPDEQALLDRARLSPARRQNLAEQMARAGTPASAPRAETERVSFFRLPWFKWVLVPATAIACAIVAFLVWNAQRDTPQKVEKLLAQAYTEQRTMEMRIPGAQYGPIRVRRGSSESHLSRPGTLLEAEKIVSQRGGSTDSNWLRVQAEAELLEGNPQLAIDKLNRALQDSPDSSEIQLLLASAYSYRGDISQDRADQETALGFIDNVLKQEPENTTALFNRAVLYEKLRMPDSAITAWSEALRHEKDTDWNAEAHRRLQELKRNHD